MEVPHRSIRYQKLDLAVVRLQAKQLRKGCLNERETRKLEKLFREREEETGRDVSVDDFSRITDEFFHACFKILKIVFVIGIVSVIAKAVLN